MTSAYHVSTSNAAINSEKLDTVADGLPLQLKARTGHHLAESAQKNMAKNLREILKNDTVPNMVGQISTSLAEAKLNIADLLNKSRGDLAYTLIDVNAAVDPAVLNRLRAIPGVLSVRLV